MGNRSTRRNSLPLSTSALQNQNKQSASMPSATRAQKAAQADPHFADGSEEEEGSDSIEASQGSKCAQKISRKSNTSKASGRKSTQSSGMGACSGDADDLQIREEDSRAVKKLKLQLQEQGKKMEELKDMVKQKGTPSSAHSVRYAKRSMSDCPLDTKMQVHNFSQVYFKVCKFLPHRYGVYHKENPICNMVMKGMRGKPPHIPDCVFYEAHVVPYMSSRWSYHRCYVYGKMQKLVQGKSKS